MHFPASISVASVPAPSAAPSGEKGAGHGAGREATEQVGGGKGSTTTGHILQ